MKGTIRPKISTMPRQKTEAAAILDLYKLVVEKKRLQQELGNLEQRRQQIDQRLAVLERQIVVTEQDVEKLRGQEAGGFARQTAPQELAQAETEARIPQLYGAIAPYRSLAKPAHTESADQFDTLMLDY